MTDSGYESPRADVFPQPCRACIAKVDPGSPADDAGLEPGMVITHVAGVPLRDLIEWRWQADGFEVEVTLEGGERALLMRDLDEDWGMSFSDSIFDGVITCCNGCTFCFMTMLPPDMRPTLYLRDDDYRLSFLQGNFVTLTNVDETELARIVEYGLSPLHVSLHAVSPDVRRELMGRNAERGMEVLERLLDAGIEVHVQVVVVPGVNDGAELVKTLSWIEARPGVLSAGFVPLGYTKYQRRFDASFSDDPDAAAAVIELIREFQEDSGVERRNPRLQIADEFYLDAGYSFPPASTYAGYPQFEDGIGMMRSFLDEWDEAAARIDEVAAELADAPMATIVCGTAFARVLAPLVKASSLHGKLRVLAVDNEFFGGNVDVTGLLTGQDIARSLAKASPQGRVILSRQMLNHEGRFLDDMTLDELARQTGCDVRACTYRPEDVLNALVD